MGGPTPATVHDFIFAALEKDAEVTALGALRAQVRDMCQQVASLTCSDLHVIVTGMFEAENRAQASDREPVADLLRLQRRLAWLQAYQREVIEGPGSEFPDMYAAGKGTGGSASSQSPRRGVRGSGRGGRAAGKAHAAGRQSSC